MGRKQGASTRHRGPKCINCISHLPRSVWQTLERRAMPGDGGGCTWGLPPRADQPTRSHTTASVGARPPVSAPALVAQGHQSLGPEPAEVIHPLIPDLLHSALPAPSRGNKVTRRLTPAFHHVAPRGKATPQGTVGSELPSDLTASCHLPPD